MSELQNSIRSENMRAVIAGSNEGLRSIFGPTCPAEAGTAKEEGPQRYQPSPNGGAVPGWGDVPITHTTV